MPLSKSARSKILSFVQEAKKLLIKEVEDQLQQFYGIRPDGTVLMIEQLTAPESEVIYTAGLLRQRLIYLKANLADKTNQETEAIRQLVREQAFTILNRFASLRMAEERGIIKETVRQAYNSEGFQIFDSITGQGQTASQYTRYKWYIYAVFDELALDLPSVFDRHSPYALLFPSEPAMDMLLHIIDKDEVTFHREEGFQAINLWKEDETIGWIYQYYNSKEEIKEMREASDLPRNSRELAIRNQFFTPRYVVQFLTDNSLGRLWYEMTNGQTALKDICKYLIASPDDVFLQKGESIDRDTLASERRIAYRPIKDPRELRLLDPACGSMHFGLYAFDLFELIYLEAWDRQPHLLGDLRNTISRQQFIAQIPEYIIRYNIHGVDIDPRALQIAGLSLWLRAQKSFDQLNLTREVRPQINKSNLVLAEGMPGNGILLSDLLEPLDIPIRKLVLSIWDLMKMAGETGLLLRIEGEIDRQIKTLAAELNDDIEKTQLTLTGGASQEQTAEKAALYATKAYRDNFLETAESEVLTVLQQLAETATNGEAYQRLLFADDTARGFAFIELCRRQYDVIVMNPPFGDSTVATAAYLQTNYPTWGKNILAAFFDRMLELSDNQGLVAAIFDRTVAIKSSYEDFRNRNFCGHIDSMADTGWEVLDANVETTTLVLNKTKSTAIGTFINIQEAKRKQQELLTAITSIRDKAPSEIVFFRNSWDFEKLPNSIIGYYFQRFEIDNFKNIKNLNELGYSARKGNDFVSFEHYRNFWEATSTTVYKHLYNGSPFNMFYLPYREIARVIHPDEYYKQHKSINIRNAEYHYIIGVGIGKFGDIMDAHVFKEGFMFTNEGMCISKITKDQAILLNGFLNSIFAQYTINQYCGLHKQAGYINLLPCPLPDGFGHNQTLSAIFNIKRKWYSLDETCLEFRHLLKEFAFSDSLTKRIAEIQDELNNEKATYVELINANDAFWQVQANIPKEAAQVFEALKNKRPGENLISINGLDDDDLNGNPVLAHEIISNLLGIVMGRWDIGSVLDPVSIPPFGDFFAPLPFMPVVSLMQTPPDYTVDSPVDGILVSDHNHPRSIIQAIKKVIRIIWKGSADQIWNELEEIGQYNSVENFVSNVNGFFDFHHKRYTKSRRETPIYWPISTASGSYTVWLYYPKINDQTLYKVVNDFVTPKQGDVLEEIKKLESNANLDNQGRKELQACHELIHELQDLEKELLKVAALPYKPNHDDGVLISAAPLCHLFRHSKWKKATEECWTALQKGEHDWSQMAMAIWPNRVRDKCQKDMSLAINHGLETLCEVKAKEKKAKTEKKGRALASIKLFE